MKRSMMLILPVLAASLPLSCGGGGSPGNPNNGLDGLAIDYSTTSDVEQDLPQRDGQDLSVDQDCTTLAITYAEPMDKPEDGYHIVLGWNGDRDLKVKVTGCGVAAADVPVFFTEEADDLGICELDLAQTNSLEDGIAAVRISSPQAELKGDCLFKACLDPELPETCIVFNVNVNPKGMPPLVVGFLPYTGSYPLVRMADVRIYKNAATGKPNCEDLNLDKLPTAQGASPGKVSLLTTVQFTKEQLLGLEAEKTQVYTVLCRAYEEGSTTPRASGCLDDVPVEIDGFTRVDCPLDDIPPKIVGTYDITSTFDMVSGLPPPIERVVNYIISFFTSPTATVLLLICDPTIWTGGSALQSLCDWVFVDPADPKIDQLNPAGEFAKELIDSILVGLLETQCPYPDNPELCKDIWFSGGDISGMLKKFTLKSTMTCTKEPDKTGFIAMGGCKERWHTIVLKWSLGKDCQGDPECGQMLLSLDSLQGGSDTVMADIEAQLVEKNTKLVIMPHHITLMYGIIIDYLLEKQLLPLIFGNGSDGLPAVDSFESMIGSLLAGRGCLDPRNPPCCKTFSLQISGSIGGLAQSVIEGACEALISTGSEYVRSFLTDLTAEPGNFTLQTPDDDPCAIFDKNKDMKFDTLGEEPEEKQCNWKAHLKLGTFDYDPDGKFFGLRQ